MRKLITVSVLMICQMVCAQSVRVMTYNIRFDNPDDGVNAWPNRIQKVVALIQKHNPDIIGMQEALHHQVQDLLRMLPDYSYVGVGRDDGKEKGEYCAIAYRNDRFGVLRAQTIWLSATGEVGSIGWDAAITRIATWVRLYDKELKQELVIANTHFDHAGKQARSGSAAYLAGYFGYMFNGRQQPFVLMGDFNCDRAEEAYAALLKIANGITDTKPANDSTGTYCGFEVGAMECKAIDFIFYTKDWALRHYEVIRDNDGKYYPSDHLPVLAAFELSKE
ncbi:endonuclease/exonuclease/phosphatase family protein [Oscillatoria amoena NRMC-F 0135]|nr:endonuclease/exonuclease/phosphatase family protein [Oscillatoria amoena NRMC-F 0135]